MNKSKTFLRQRQSVIEQRLDPRWQPVTAAPVMSAGNIHYEVAGRTRAIDCAGLGLVQAVVDSLGLRQTLVFVLPECSEGDRLGRPLCDGSDAGA